MVHISLHCSSTNSAPIQFPFNLYHMHFYMTQSLRTSQYSIRMINSDKLHLPYHTSIDTDHDLQEIAVSIFWFMKLDPDKCYCHEQKGNGLFTGML